MNYDKEIKQLELIIEKLAKQDEFYCNQYIKTNSVLNQYRLVFDPLINNILREKRGDIDMSQLSTNKRVRFIAAVLNAYEAQAQLPPSK